MSYGFDAEQLPPDGTEAPRPRMRWGWRIIGFFSYIFVIAFGILALDTLPKLDRQLLGPLGPDALAITVLDREGDEIANRGGRYAAIVPLDEMPPYLVQAVLATEDQRFYDHFGFDLLGIGRAVVANFRAGSIVQGGSSITQQLAKNLYLGSERTFWRKAQEALITFWLEHEYSKEDILTLYMNRIYLGAGAYGMEAAAQFYFDKSARDVTLAEAALLAGLIKAPSRYAPTNDLLRAQRRGELVLRRLVDANVLTEGQVFAARATPATIVERTPREGSQYFVDWIASEIDILLPGISGQLIVETTLDPVQQAAGEIAIGDAISKRANTLASVEVNDPALPAEPPVQGALVAMDTDGAIRAMVGGRNYLESQFNRATQAERQPGSAFKPFVYLAALEQGFRPESRLSDAPVYVDGWSPENLGRFRGSVSLLDAMKYSINTVAVRLSEQIGRDKVIEAAERLGIRSPLASHASIALGTEEVTLVDLTSSYAVFANGGFRARPYGIKRILTPLGEVLYEQQSLSTRIVAPGAARSMNYLLYQVILTGTGSRANIGGRQAAGKTGTSQEGRDAWFVGYTADQVAGVWFGHDDASPMANAQGGGISAETWANFMKTVHKGRPLTDLAGGKAAPVRRPTSQTQQPAASEPSPAQQALHRYYSSLSNLFRQAHRDQLNPARGFRRGGQTLR
ncbi:MAG: PBP1A family penicillin-binding protein [Alphaproteobacteria bacterium]|nr:PBP1A family penicillin-binding protein [Alphaproteobacteria bacterium]MBO6628896.1 PBP1A family penicillin-binding protein [Alphaproteobacteria bacterium]MDF1625903.1 PBP1A family penicillin-binding protein [Parvibaculaceae bacterium]